MEIQFSQIIFQMITFGVVWGALTFLVYKPVLKALEQRAKKIQESQQAADELLSEREALEKLKQKAAEQSKKDAAELMAEAKKQADKKKADLFSSAKQEVQSYVEEEKEKWTQEKKQMMKQMQSEMTEAVFTISERVLKNSIDKKAQSKLIDQGIEEVLQAL